MDQEGTPQFSTSRREDPAPFGLDRIQQQASDSRNPQATIRLDVFHHRPQCIDMRRQRTRRRGTFHVPLCHQRPFARPPELK
jgi:hypothetical protein